MKATTNNRIKLDVLMGRVSSDLEMHDGLWKTMQQKLKYEEFMKGIVYPMLITICSGSALKASGRNFALLLLTDAGEYYQRHELVKNSGQYIEFAKRFLGVSQEKPNLDLSDVAYRDVEDIFNYILENNVSSRIDLHINGLIEGLKTMKGNAHKINNQRLFLEKVLHYKAQSMRENTKTHDKDLAIVEQDVQCMLKSAFQRIESLLK